MELAVYLYVVQILAFVLGATAFLAWSLAAGEWRDLPEQAAIVLDDWEPGDAPATER